MPILSDNRLILAVLLFLFGCSTEKPESFDFNGGTIGLKRVNDSHSYIFHTKNDEVISYWKLPYPVYRFDSYVVYHSDCEKSMGGLLRL